MQFLRRGSNDKGEFAFSNREKAVEALKEIEDLTYNSFAFKQQEVELNLIKNVSMEQWAIATPKLPILATDALFVCTGILAYDLNRQYTFLSHSVPGLFTYKMCFPRDSIHIMNMLDTLLPEELYQLRFVILSGRVTDAIAIETIISTIRRIRKKNIEVKSIELKKSFINGIQDKNVMVNAGGSIAFDSRNGNMTIYNPVTNKHYSYSESQSILVKTR